MSKSSSYYHDEHSIIITTSIKETRMRKSILSIILTREDKVVKRILFIGLACIILMTVGLTAANAAPSRLDGTNGCTDCHNSEKRELDASNHGHLGSGTGMGMYDKWCALPNFILAEEGHSAWNTKCGGCHIGGNGLGSFDKDYQCQWCHDTADPNGAVTVASCAAQCHAPKDWRKRGDVFDAASDVHLAAGMVCQTCHETKKHKIGKGSVIDTTEASQYPMKLCVDCHGLAPHVIADAMYNDHTDKLAFVHE